MGRASRQRWNHDQIPEIGSLDRLLWVSLQRERKVRRRRPPRLGYRIRTPSKSSVDDVRRASGNRASPPIQRHTSTQHHGLCKPPDKSSRQREGAFAQQEAKLEAVPERGLQPIDFV